MASFRFKSSRRIGAVTAVELVMVIATVALLGAIAMPRYRNAGATYRLDAAFKRVAADIAYGRAQALATSKSQTLVYDTSTSNYTLANVTSLDNSSSTYTVDSTAVPYKAKLQSATFGGPATLDFDSYGTPRGGGTVVVAINGVIKSILVDVSTGRKTLSETISYAWAGAGQPITRQYNGGIAVSSAENVQKVPEPHGLPSAIPQQCRFTPMAPSPRNLRGTTLGP